MQILDNIRTGVKLELVIHLWSVSLFRLRTITQFSCSVNPFSIYLTCFCEQRPSCLTSGLLRTVSMPNPLFLMSNPPFLWKSYRQRRVLESRENFWSNLRVFSKTPFPLLAIQTCICCEKSCSAHKKNSTFASPSEQYCAGFVRTQPQPFPHLLPPYHLVPSTYVLVPSLISLGLASKPWGRKADWHWLGLCSRYQREE